VGRICLRGTAPEAHAIAKDLALAGEIVGYCVRIELRFGDESRHLLCVISIIGGSYRTPIFRPKGLITTRAAIAIASNDTQASGGGTRILSILVPAR
jgi:hypothetical protein